MKKLLDKIIENGIIISLFLGLAYLFLYRYQKGKLSYYDIPLIYIDLSLSNVIEIFVTILLVVYFLYLSLRTIVDSTPQIKQYKTRKIIFFTIAYVIYVGIVFVIVETWTVACTSVTIIYLLCIIVNFISPLFIKDKKLSYKEKWAMNSKSMEERDAKEHEQRNNGFFANISDGVSKLGIITCILVSLSSTFALAGEQSAKSMEEYYIANDYDNQVIVHYTQDVYILMPYEEGLLKNEYLIVPSNDIGKISKEKIGVLKLEEK